MQRMASAFIDFLERCHKDGDEFCNQIVRVTGDETWVLFVNVETKGQWMHTHSPNKPQKCKQTSACQKAGSNCFLGQERSADGGIHTTRDHSNVTYCETLQKNSVGPFRSISTGSCLTTLLTAWSHSERLPPVYVPEELVGITTLQQQWVDGRCVNVVELIDGRLWQRHTKTCSLTDECLNSGGDYVEK
jgi:hypothetical protein